MQRWIPILGGVLALQLLIAGTLAMKKDALTVAAPETQLVSTDVKNADRILIESKPGADASGGSAARIELVKKNGAWVLPQQFDGPVNATKVDELLGKLADVKRGLPIATSKSAFKRFKVAEEEFERRVTLKQGDKDLGTVYFGNSPAVRKSNARASKDDAVYTVDFPIYDLPTENREWLNVDILHRQANELVEIDLSGGLKLVRGKGADKDAGPWQAEGVSSGKQLDAAHAETLATAVGNTYVDGVLGTEAKPEWQQDRPLLNLTLKDKKGQSSTWILSKPSSGDFYVLKTSTHPWYFSLGESTAKSLLDGSDSKALLTDAAPAKNAAKKAG